MAFHLVFNILNNSGKAPLLDGSVEGKSIISDE